MEQVRIGVIGIGAMGAKHAEMIYAGVIEGLRLTAVAARRAERRLWAKDHLPGVTVLKEGEELIASGLCDAVLVATPHPTHAAFATGAMKAGLHVLCEKPAAVYADEARRMNEVADEAGVVFGMMYNQRTDPLYVRLKQLLDSGALGQVKRVNWIATYNYRPDVYFSSVPGRGTWRGDGGGVLLNQSSHQLDLLCWLFGQPVKVSGFTYEGKWHDIETEDDATFVFELEDGATGTFVSSTTDWPGSDRLEVTMSGGKVVCEDGQLKIWKLAVDERLFRKQAVDGFAKPEYTMEREKWPERGPQHRGVLQGFANAVLGKGPLVADGREGLKSLALINAVYLSGWLGQPMTVPVDESLYLEKLREKMTK